MNTIRNAVWRAYELFVTVANLLQSPLLLALRLYFFWQLFQTGQGKLSNIAKIIIFSRDLHIPAPNCNAYFVSSLECFGGLLTYDRPGFPALSTDGRDFDVRRLLDYANNRHCRASSVIPISL